MGKAQLPQLRKLRCALIFYFKTLRKLRCGLKSLKFVALSFFFRLIAQFYTLNLILFYFDRNFDKWRPSLANYSGYSFLPKIVKNAVFALCCEISIAKVRLRFNLVPYKNAVPQLRNCVALQLNQKVYCGSCAGVQKLKKLNFAFCAALLLVEEIIALLI